jgi:hypothetical protein
MLAVCCVDSRSEVSYRARECLIVCDPGISTVRRTSPESNPRNIELPKINPVTAYLCCIVWYNWISTRVVYVFFSGLCNNTLICSDCIALSDTFVADNELEKTCRKRLWYHLCCYPGIYLRTTEKSDEKLESGWPLSRPRSEPGLSSVRSRTRLWISVEESKSVIFSVLA